LPLFGPFAYVKMIKYVNESSSLLQFIYWYGVYVRSVPGRFYKVGELRPIYGGFYTIRGHGEGCFFAILLVAQPMHWTPSTLDDLQFINVDIYFSFSFFAIFELLCGYVLTSYAEARCNA
jgi:hypothetical protein